MTSKRRNCKVTNAHFNLKSNGNKVEVALTELVTTSKKKIKSTSGSVAVQRQTFKLEGEKAEELDFEVLGNLQNLMSCVEKSLKCTKCKKIEKIVSISPGGKQGVKCAGCQTLTDIRISSTVVDLVLTNGPTKGYRARKASSKPLSSQRQGNSGFNGTANTSTPIQSDRKTRSSFKNKAPEPQVLGAVNGSTFQEEGHTAGAQVNLSEDSSHMEYDDNIQGQEDDYFGGDNLTPESMQNASTSRPGKVTSHGGNPIANSALCETNPGSLSPLPMSSQIISPRPRPTCGSKRKRNGDMIGNKSSSSFVHQEEFLDMTKKIDILIDSSSSFVNREEFLDMNKKLLESLETINRFLRTRFPEDFV